MRCGTRIFTHRTWGIFCFGLFFFNCKNEAKEMMLRLCLSIQVLRQKDPLNCVSFKTARGENGLWTLHFFLSYFNFRFFLRTWIGGWVAWLVRLCLGYWTNGARQQAQGIPDQLHCLAVCSFPGFLSELPTASCFQGKPERLWACSRVKHKLTNAACHPSWGPVQVFFDI